jgi:CheY-like chemotaxis protein
MTRKKGLSKSSSIGDTLNSSRISVDDSASVGGTLTKSNFMSSTISRKISCNELSNLRQQLSTDSEANFNHDFHLTCKPESFLLSQSVLEVLENPIISDRFVEKEKLKLLVVDDSSMNRKMLCKLLFLQGYDCDEATDGMEAVNKVKTFVDIEGKSVYRAIFMDFMMPNMDGPTATKEIRKAGFNRKIIGVTGNALQVDIDELMRAGATKVLTKPVKTDDIINVLRGKSCIVI